MLLSKDSVDAALTPLYPSLSRYGDLKAASALKHLT